MASLPASGEPAEPTEPARQTSRYGTGEAWPTQVRYAPAVAVFLVAVVGHLPALGSYWNQDDWGLLARAAGLITTTGFPARFVSQVLYWDILYPVWDLATQPYAWSRLLLHGGCAFLVARIAARGTASPLGQLLAGLLVAVTPFVFKPLYWASGVQELLGGFLALIAVERWLAPGRLNLLWVFLGGSLAILAKESGLGLPLLLAALALGSGRGDRPLATPPRSTRLAWCVVVALGIVAAGEAFLVWNHFDHAPGKPYGLGAWPTPLTNLAGYGWWLISPGPFFAPHPDLARGVAGGAVWLLWTAGAVLVWRRGQKWLAACLGAALLSLAPALPLASHIEPSFLYLAGAAVALAVTSLLPRLWSVRPVVAVGLILAATAWAWTGTTVRLKSRDAQGLPADPLVLRTAISYEATTQLRALRWPQTERQEYRLILLQPPAPGVVAKMAANLGENWVTGSVLHTAVGGFYGPRLVLGDSVTVDWVNGLEQTPPDAFVLVQDGPHFRAWGMTPQALLYLTLTEVARGQFARAERHLLRAALISARTMPFFFDPDLMLVSSAAVRLQADGFRAYLEVAEHSGAAGRRSPNTSRESDEDTGSQSTVRSAALVNIFDELLVICCADPDALPQRPESSSGRE